MLVHETLDERDLDLVRLAEGEQVRTFPIRLVPRAATQRKTVAARSRPQRFEEDSVPGAV